MVKGPGPPPGGHGRGPPGPLLGVSPDENAVMRAFNRLTRSLGHTNAEKVREDPGILRPSFPKPVSPGRMPGGSGFPTRSQRDANGIRERGNACGLAELLGQHTALLGVRREAGWLLRQ
jgi:hypothetical protein